MESRTFGEPVANQRRFVGAVVIHDHVHVEAAGHLRLDQIQEFAELRRAVSLMELGDHLTGFRIERRKQRRRAVPFVVVRPTLDLPRLHRQQGLRPVEGLNLGLLVDAEHRRVRRRIHIESGDISHFVDEERIGRQLECFGPMRLQPERAPDATDPI
jgi:hypothetical protein